MLICFGLQDAFKIDEFTNVEEKQYTKNNYRIANIRIMTKLD